jgi:hypothetical protein
MSYCTRATCLAHRLACYFNLQDGRWVHASGWECEGMAEVPPPAAWPGY